MRRTITGLIVGALALGVGIAAAALFTQSLAVGVEPSEVAPVSSTYSCEEPATTDDFGRFWSDFRAAVRADDKAGLFSLTRRCEFVWWDWEREGVRLRSVEELAAHPLSPPALWRNPAVNAPLVFETRGDFDRNYHIVFSRGIKRRILGGELAETYPGHYRVCWRERGLNCLRFERVEQVGYKFIGNDWEP